MLEGTEAQVMSKKLVVVKLTEGSAAWQSGKVPVKRKETNKRDERRKEKKKKNFSDVTQTGKPNGGLSKGKTHRGATKERSKTRCR